MKLEGQMAQAFKNAMKCCARQGRVPEYIPIGMRAWMLRQRTRHQFWSAQPVRDA
jgi:hypothetical protein